MPTQVQYRGGTTAETATFTGANKEITVDTDKRVPVVHDGATPGGFPLQRARVADVFDVAGVVTMDFDMVDVGQLDTTLTALTVTAAATTVSNGQKYMLRVRNNGGSPIALTLDGGVIAASPDLPAPASLPVGLSYLGFIYDQDVGRFCLIAAITGF